MGFAPEYDDGWTEHRPRKWPLFGAAIFVMAYAFATGVLRIEARRIDQRLICESLDLEVKTNEDVEKVDPRAVWSRLHPRLKNKLRDQKTISTMAAISTADPKERLRLLDESLQEQRCAPLGRYIVAKDALETTPP